VFRVGTKKGDLSGFFTNERKKCRAGKVAEKWGETTERKERVRSQAQAAKIKPGIQSLISTGGVVGQDGLEGFRKGDNTG